MIWPVHGNLYYSFYIEIPKEPKTKEDLFAEYKERMINRKRGSANELSSSTKSKKSIIGSLARINNNY